MFVWEGSSQKRGQQPAAGCLFVLVSRSIHHRETCHKHRVSPLRSAYYIYSCYILLHLPLSPHLSLPHPRILSSLPPARTRTTARVFVSSTKDDAHCSRRTRFPHRYKPNLLSQQIAVWNSFSFSSPIHPPSLFLTSPLSLVSQQTRYRRHGICIQLKFALGPLSSPLTPRSSRRRLYCPSSKTIRRQHPRPRGKQAVFAGCKHQPPKSIKSPYSETRRISSQ